MDTKTSTQSAILIKGAQLFDGKSPKLIEGRDVLVENNKITRIDKNITAPNGAATIETDGRTLIPGLIDVHWHSV